jgi:hypothetical protein
VRASCSFFSLFFFFFLFLAKYSVPLLWFTSISSTTVKTLVSIGTSLRGHCSVVVGLTHSSIRKLLPISRAARHTLQTPHSIRCTFVFRLINVQPAAFGPMLQPIAFVWYFTVSRAMIVLVVPKKIKFLHDRDRFLHDINQVYGPHSVQRRR